MSAQTDESCYSQHEGIKKIVLNKTKIGFGYFPLKNKNTKYSLMKNEYFVFS